MDITLDGEAHLLEEAQLEEEAQEMDTTLDGEVHRQLKVWEILIEKEEAVSLMFLDGIVRQRLKISLKD